jgi:hypothetical protein
VTLLLGQGNQQKIAKEDIELRKTVDVSSMPEKLNDSMNGNEFIGLLQFLFAQQATPQPNASPSAASGGQ